MKLRYAIFAGLTLGAATARADERFLAYTYGWFTPAHFERELELTYDHFGHGRAFGQIEFEYGATDRWVVAPYLLFSHENGKTELAGWKLEQRYRFGKFAYGKLLPAIYFEVQRENGEPTELEGKLILSTMPNRDWIASGNLIVEKKLETGAREEIGYSVGAARIFRTYSLGVEAKGNFLENEHSVGPTVGLRIGPGSKVLIAPALGYGKATESRVRLLFEHEF